jgi:hypothetical protein
MVDKVSAIYHGLWRKAAGMSEELEIPCTTESEAKRLRFALYNSVKQVRKHPERDLDLVDAVDAVMLGFKEGDAKVLVMRKKTSTKLMQTLAGLLGVESAEAVETEEEREMKEVMRRFEEKLAKELPAPAHNPYRKGG